MRRRASLGTGDFFGPEFNQHRLELCEHSDYLTLFGPRDVAFTPGERFKLTVDYYRVDIDDRITLSERIGGDEVTQYIEDQLGIEGVLGVRFFTNAIDTQTDGFDIVADYTLDLGPGSLLLSAAYNKSDTEVTHVDPNPPELDAIGVDNVLFGVEERNTIETASPDDKLILTAHWTT